MLMAHWPEPGVFWLNLTNAVLGLVVVVAAVALGIAAGGDILARWRDGPGTKPRIHGPPASTGKGPGR
jgi:hypothetical protein